MGTSTNEPPTVTSDDGLPIWLIILITVLGFALVVGFGMCIYYTCGKKTEDP